MGVSMMTYVDVPRVTHNTTYRITTSGAMVKVNAMTGIHARRFVSPILRQCYPGSGTCQSCNWPWAVAEGHDVQISERSSCFPLCEDCWMTLVREGKDEEIVRLTREVYDTYWREAPEPWSVYEAAMRREIVRTREQLG